MHASTEVASNLFYPLSYLHFTSLKFTPDPLSPPYARRDNDILAAIVITCISAVGYTVAAATDIVENTTSDTPGQGRFLCCPLLIGRRRRRHFLEPTVSVTLMWDTVVSF